MNKKPLLSSMHTHTIFCDGEDDIETMCRAAYENGLFAVGFSAHVSCEKQLGREIFWNLKENRVNDYVNEVLAAKKRWNGKINVFLGLEADYIKNIRSPNDDDIKALNLDYIIGSVHYLVPKNGKEPFTVDGSLKELEDGINECFDGDAVSLMHSYYDAQLEMISMGGFDILGHADILKKYCHNKNFWPEKEENARQIEIVKAVSHSGIVIEVNTGGLNRKKINETFPSLSFLKIIQKYNIPVIITADAHKAEHIDGNYNFALNMLKLADIKEHFLFNGKNNGKTIWLKEKI